MTDQTSAQPVENVGRGTLFALLAIPIGMIAFSLVAGFFGIITGIVAIAIPYLAAWLYAKGAGAPLTRAGWGQFVGVSALAVVIGTFTGIVAGSYFLFSAVGGDGGILGSAFWTTVRNQFTTNIEDALVPILLGLGLGAVGIFGVIRGASGFGRFGQQQTPGAIPDAAAPTTTAPPVAPPAPPAAQSPGVILNGEPLDPDKK